MAHLKDRLCLVPFSDLADCPDVTHHAMGSPYFDDQGQPKEADPVVIAVRSDIVDESLPRATVLAVSCNTRPYQSYGPVIRRVFECSKPNLYPELRRLLEGVMEQGEVRELPPGGLEGQISRMYLACVATMTSGTNELVLQRVMGKLVHLFRGLSSGSTMRIPLIGTGKSRTEAATEKVYQDVIELTVSSLQEALFPSNPLLPPRRLLLLHPFAFESQCIAMELAKKSIFLSILDKMGLSTTEARLVYGIACGQKESHLIVQPDTFPAAIDHFDQALTFLLDGQSRKAVQEAARGVEVEPALGGVFSHINFLATKERGLLEAILQEAIDLASKGRIDDAFRVARTLTSLHTDSSKHPLIGPKEHRFIHALRRCYVGYRLADLEAQVLYEKYMQAEESLALMHNNLPEDTSLTGEFLAAPTSFPASELLPIEDRVSDELNQFHAKICQKKVQNAFHVAIRKLSSDPIETEGVRRALDSLQEYKEHQSLPLSESEEQIASQIRQLAADVEQSKHDMPIQQLHRKVLDQLGSYLGHHKTYRIEEARYFLRGGDNHILSREDILQAWNHLEQGYLKDPGDPGILAYLGFVMLLQGPRVLHHAETFFLLWAKMIERDLSSGRFRLHQLEAPSGKKIDVPMIYPDAIQAHAYHQRWLELVRQFATLSKELQDGSGLGDKLVEQYQKIMKELAQIGRSDLARLYELYLGERWISLMVSRTQKGWKIPIPGVGDISLDLIVNLFRRFRRWRLFRRLHHESVGEAMRGFLDKMKKSYTEHH